MRRAFLVCATLLAAAASAANPYSLDRNGVLWNASAGTEGLVLTGTKDGTQVVRSVVPFPVTISGTTDTQIQVAADDLTGKVVVVWQRNWAYQVSEIMMAVWENGSWERVEHLSQDLAAYPRNPMIKLTQVSTTDPAPSGDPSSAVAPQDSFLHVVWWEGLDQAHADYALLCLTAGLDDPAALVEKNLDEFVGIGLTCDQPVPPSVLEHPLFADEGASDRAEVLFGSQRLCLFQLLQISFVPNTSPPVAATGGMTATTQRRRSVPIFGLKKAFALTRDISMEGTRVILGGNLNPVAYRVVGPTIQYVTYSDQGWSPVRTLAVADGLTLDQAIPLVENLAR